MILDRRKFIARSSENAFERMCIDSNLSCTPPARDEEGWDSFVEFPINTKLTIHRDAQPPSIKCLVQVKSTDDPIGSSVPMKVSNWEKLSKSSLPTFMAIFYFSGQNEAVAVYICHFGLERIAQALKKVRELESTNDLSRVHHRKMLFAPKEGERLDRKDARALKKAIVESTGLDANVYGQTKANIIKTVGFDQKVHSLAFKATLPPGDLSDVFLGLKEFEVEDISIGSYRFGIELLDHYLEFGTIRIQPHSVGKCKILATSRRTRMRSSLNADIFVSALPQVPEHVSKSLIVCNEIKIELASTSGHFTACIPDDVPRDFYELVAEASFLKTMQEDDAKISIILSDGNSLPLHFNHLPPKNAYFLETHTRLTILEKALRLANDRSSFKLRIQKIYDQDKNLRWLQCLSRKSTIRFETNDVPHHLLVKKQKGFFGCAVWIEVEDRFLVLLCFWNAFIQRQGAEIIFDLKSCRVFESIWTEEVEKDVAIRWKGFQEFCQEESSTLPLMMFGPPRKLDPSESTATLRLE